MPDNLQDWMDWVTGLTGADAPDPILTHSEIEDIIDGVIGTMGVLHTDMSTMPVTATIRPRGVFTDPNDLQAYLNDGSLLTWDEFGNFTPSPIVNILKKTGDLDDNIEYEVWINEEGY